MALKRDQLSMDGVIRVMKVKFMKLHIRVRMNKINAAVVAEQLGFAQAVLHHFSGKGIERYKRFG
jgi:hypothetical protein